MYTYISPGQRRCANFFRRQFIAPQANGPHHTCIQYICHILYITADIQYIYIYIYIYITWPAAMHSLRPASVYCAAREQSPSYIYTIYIPYTIYYRVYTIYIHIHIQYLASGDAIIVRCRFVAPPAYGSHHTYIQYILYTCRDGGNTFTPERYRLELNSAHTFQGDRAPRPTHSFWSFIFEKTGQSVNVKQSQSYNLYILPRIYNIYTYTYILPGQRRCTHFVRRRFLAPPAYGLHHTYI